MLFLVHSGLSQQMLKGQPWKEIMLAIGCELEDVKLEGITLKRF